MLDFTPVREKRMTLGELAGDLSRDDLRALSNEMIDTLLGHLATCEDADITFGRKPPDAPGKPRYVAGRAAWPEYSLIPVSGRTN